MKKLILVIAALSFAAIVSAQSSASPAAATAAKPAAATATGMGWIVGGLVQGSSPFIHIALHEEDEGRGKGIAFVEQKRGT